MSTTAVSFGDCYITLDLLPPTLKNLLIKELRLGFIHTGKVLLNNGMPNWTAFAATLSDTDPSIHQL